MNKLCVILLTLGLLASALFAQNGTIGGIYPTGNGLVSGGSVSGDVLCNVINTIKACSSGGFTVSGGNVSMTGTLLNSANGAASSPSLFLTGAPFAGTGTTSFPQFFIQPATATPATTWGTAGTTFGLNAHTGITYLMDLRVDGVQQFQVTPGGTLLVAGDFTGSSGMQLGFGSNGNLRWTAADRMRIRGAAAQNYIQVGLAAIASGFGTSPAILGTDSAGRLTVGTGGIATTGTINFAATWAAAPACTVTDESTSLLLTAIASTTQLIISAATPFTAADKLVWVCIGY